MAYLAVLHNDVDKGGGVLCTADEEGCLHYRQVLYR